MSLKFVKVIPQILDSSIADDTHARHLFMDLLLLSDINGIVDRTPRAIAAATRTPIKTVLRCLALLESEDPQSRSAAFGGRRIVRLDAHREWGWRIVNFRTYLEQPDAEAIRAYERQRKRDQRVTPNVPDSPGQTPNVPDSPGQSRTVPDKTLPLAPSLPRSPLSPTPPLTPHSSPSLDSPSEREKERERGETPPSTTLPAAVSTTGGAPTPPPEGSGGGTDGLVGEKMSVEVAVPSRDEVVEWFMAQPLALTTGADQVPEHLRRAWVLRLAGWLVDQANSHPKNWRRYVQTRFAADVVARHPSLFPQTPNGQPGPASNLARERILSARHAEALQKARREGTGEAWDDAHRLKKELEEAQQQISGGAR